jgi:hypothetical protein
MAATAAFYKISRIDVPRGSWDAQVLEDCRLPVDGDGLWREEGRADMNKASTKNPGDDRLSEAHRANSLAAWLSGHFDLKERSCCGFAAGAATGNNKRFDYLLRLAAAQNARGTRGPGTEGVRAV